MDTLKIGDLELKIVERIYASRKYTYRLVYDDRGEWIANIVERVDGYVAVVAGGALYYLGNGGESYSTPEEAVQALSDRRRRDASTIERTLGYGRRSR